MQAAPPGPVLNQEIEMCQNPLGKSPIAMLGHLTKKSSCSLSKEPQPLHHKFPQSHKFPGRYHTGRMEAQLEHGMHIWQGLCEELTNSLPPAEAHSSHDEFSFCTHIGNHLNREGCDHSGWVCSTSRTQLC